MKILWAVAAGRLARLCHLCHRIWTHSGSLIWKHCTWCGYGHGECHCPSSYFQSSGQLLPLFSQLQVGLDPRPRQDAWLSFWKPRGGLCFETMGATVLILVCVCVEEVGVFTSTFFSSDSLACLFIHSTKMHWVPLCSGLSDRGWGDDSGVAPSWRRFWSGSHRPMSALRPCWVMHLIGKDLGNHWIQPLQCCKGVELEPERRGEWSHQGHWVVTDRAGVNTTSPALGPVSQSVSHLCSRWSLRKCALLPILTISHGSIVWVPARGTCSVSPVLQRGRC